MSTPGKTTTAMRKERAGDPGTAAIEAAWREFAGELRSFIGRRVSRPEDADDILQLVALRLTQNAEDRDRRTLLAWLYTVTRNAITDYYRSAVHRREVVTDGVPEQAWSDPSIDEDDSAEQALAGLASCVRPLLRLLPSDQAAALELVDLGGRSQVDAARVAGISVSGMKSRVQRGRRGLQKAITECCQIQLDARGAVQEFHSHSGADCACSADA
ncbi:sigma-70 family RNA polymerase sigma factor [Nocardioides sp.]|uniref:sigma-70 family RNA polymerase sigma factor n=1 Tax=Nocardioides sp. TaxID=35761 RepID=UPI002734B36B|nr:sigma-70 family RNA polymerase sigma factor [Nocardioides sp.]MDP3892262.1 sigma-70 family RNA polymerase sigma factor [Nocardioides sp.]